MSPDIKLLLIEQELERFMRDQRPSPIREAVHVDRTVRILHLESTGVSAR